MKIKLSQFRSNTEREYAEMLAIQKLNGEIRDWRYEPIRLKLAEQTTYTPDFMVITKEGGRTELH